MPHVCIGANIVVSAQSSSNAMFTVSLNLSAELCEEDFSEALL